MINISVESWSEFKKRKGKNNKREKTRILCISQKLLYLSFFEIEWNFLSLLEVHDFSFMQAAVRLYEAFKKKAQHLLGPVQMWLQNWASVSRAWLKRHLLYTSIREISEQTLCEPHLVDKKKR